MLGFCGPTIPLIGELGHLLSGIQTHQGFQCVECLGGSYDS